MKQTRYVFIGVGISKTIVSAFSLRDALLKYYRLAENPVDAVEKIVDEYGNEWHNVKLTATFDEQIKENSMTQTKPLETAFPTGADGDPGLTKREYFAAMAMQGLVNEWAHPLRVSASSDGTGTVAKKAVLMADALIEALNKETV